MARGFSSVANYIMNELHTIATLSQICFVSQLFEKNIHFYTSENRMPKPEIKTDVRKNYFEGVNLTFVVWELKFLRRAFCQINVFPMPLIWYVIIYIACKFI
jgi:hypothetical protein